MKVVAVSQRVDAFPERNEMRDALDQRLTAFLLLASYLPVPVPNELENAIHDWLAVVQPAALVLSGGNDIGECPERDAIERTLLDHAREHQIPVLGICRGMQMMANWAGANLHPVKGHVQTRHQLSGEIADVVNSYHTFALDGCPEDFDVISRSEDGEIEAIRHQFLPWEGWMWHPEREPGFTHRDLERLRTLFQ